MDEAILHIDTAANKGLVMISKAGQPVALQTNLQAIEHAAFLQPAIQHIMAEANVAPKDIQAIAVANGPGSYTGLRVGLASAKGLCFAWQKPLITLSSLQLMALSTVLSGYLNIPSNAYIAPMIDARRMEVFYSLFKGKANIITEPPTAAIIDENFLHNYLENNPIIFVGDGSEKWKKLCVHPNAIFAELPSNVHAFALQAFNMYQQKIFADLAYSEPFYTKDFYTTAKKMKTLHNN